MLLEHRHAAEMRKSIFTIYTVLKEDADESVSLLRESQKGKEILG